MVFVSLCTSTALHIDRTQGGREKSRVRATSLKMTTDIRESHNMKYIFNASKLHHGRIFFHSEGVAGGVEGAGGVVL